jgi:hypothetical protein
MCLQPLPRRRIFRPVMDSGPVGRSSDLQARQLALVFLLAAASQSQAGPVRCCGFRSCLPLRGSSGV